jgi:KDO2-lipid IV(A) lauroyltransferase
MKTLSYSLLAVLLRIVFFLTDCLPEGATFKISEKLASIYMFSSRRYRKRIREHLEIAFGWSCDDQQVYDLTGKVVKNLGLIFAETLLSSTNKRDTILDQISVQGTENLDNALSCGKGIMAVSAHLGNFSLIGVKMLSAGYPFTMLVKESKYPGIARVARAIQKKQGGHYIYTEPWPKALRHITSSLRNNEIVCLLADENKRHSETVVEFFGHPAPTAIGPAMLSLRTGALIVPIFIVRHADLSHTIFIEPHLTPVLTGNISEDIFTITTAYTHVIENYVRKYPDQWFWVNRRWRKGKMKQRKPNSAGKEITVHAGEGNVPQ